MTAHPSTAAQPVATSATHSAFPGACQLADGALLLCWRDGSDHFEARDGRILLAWSADGGVSWSAPWVVVDDGRDARDPSLTADGDTVWLTYFTGSAQNSAEGCYLRGSGDGGQSWGPERRIDTLPHAAISAPLVRVGDDLLTTFYGTGSGTTRWSSWVARSADGGDTWTSTRVCDGYTDVRDYPEPWLVYLGGDDLLVLVRWGLADAIAELRSNDGGQTWTAPRPVFTGSGRPAAVVTSAGTVVCVYRSLPGKHAAIRSSTDGGATWWPEKRLFPAPAGGQMAYAAPVTTGTGLVFCPFSVESDTTRSTMRVTYLRTSPGDDPLGGVVLDQHTRIAADLNLTVAADDFDRPDGPVGHTPGGLEWHTHGPIRIESGTLRCGSADWGPERAWVQGAADADVEADLLWSGGSGVGLIFRVAGPNDYFLVAVEADGTRVRLYDVRGGSHTVLSDIAWTTRPGVYHRLAVSARGDVAYWWLNNRLVSAAFLPNRTATGAHGVQLNEGWGGTHRCRRIVARA